MSDRRIGCSSWRIGCSPRQHLCSLKHGVTAALCASLGVAVPRALAAATYYVDPETGSAAGTGAPEAPWASPQDVIDADLIGSVVAPGDTLVLASGDYGELRIEGFTNSEPITLEAGEGAAAAFSRIVVRNSAGWVLRGVQVEGEAAGYLIDLDGANEDIVVEECLLRSTGDTSSWTAQDWIQRASSGIAAEGKRLIIRKNQLTNVGYGISVTATESLVEDNVVDSFSRDGLRGLGNDTVFQYNTVKNCYAVDDHHDDGFQSWSVGQDGSVGTGQVVGIILRGNTFLSYEDPEQPFRGTLQGIGCFDGTYVDWVIENNVVITDHWHGITLLGARGCRIVNNTVLDPNEERPGPPWISIDAHKDGTPPEGCLVSNNLATDYANAEGVTEVNNEVIHDPAALFVDAQAYDVHLRDDSPAIDRGTSERAPLLDRDRIPRPQGSAVDLGAYEWHEPSVEPVVGGASGLPEPSSRAGHGGVSGVNGGLAPQDDGEEGDGCGCRVAGAGAQGYSGWLGLAVLLALWGSVAAARPARDGRHVSPRG